ncbi:MAG TPA: GNAT family N-acetyltransferase [Pseudonocardiaceae bacterium]
MSGKWVANGDFAGKTGVVIVREFRESDADAAHALTRLAFGGPRVRGGGPPPGWRSHVAELDGRVAGHVGVLNYRQYFGGRAVPMGGVIGVAVDPYARGRGVAQAMLDVVIADMRAQGQCVSALYPSVPPLYRTRGWEQAGTHQRVTLPLDLLGSLPKPAVRRVIRPAGKDDLPALRAAYRAVASTVDGMLDRATESFDTENVFELDIVDLVPGQDEVLGYLTAHRPDGETLKVYDLVAADRDTALTLLRQLASWAGQLKEVSLRLIDPAVWDLVLPQPMWHDVNNHPWMLRVIDLPAAVAARGWPAAERMRPFAVDIEVVDEQAPWHAGRHRIVVQNGQVKCEPGGTGAVRMSARALGPWFAGSADSAALRRAGLLDGDPTIAARLDTLTGAPRMARMANAF